MSDNLNRMREQESDRRREETVGPAAGMTLGVTAVAIILAAVSMLYWVL